MLNDLNMDYKNSTPVIVQDTLAGNQEYNMAGRQTPNADSNLPGHATQYQQQCTSFIEVPSGRKPVLAQASAPNCTEEMKYGDDSQRPLLHSSSTTNNKRSVSIPLMEPLRRNSVLSHKSYFSGDWYEAKAKGSTGGWLAWANEIRSRKAQRMENLSRMRRQKELQRVPEHVRKGRFESSTYYMESERHQKQYEPLTPSKPKPVIRGKKKKIAKKTKPGSDEFTDDQWHRLYEFWEHHTFTVCRILAVVTSIAALIMLGPVIANTTWTKYIIEKNVNVTIDYFWDEYTQDYVYCENITCFYTDVQRVHEEIHGLWYNCTVNYTTFMGLDDRRCTKLDYPASFKLAPFVTGPLCVVCFIGTFALVLNVIGFVRLRLADRIYCFHSAGELYLLCSLLFILGLSVRVATANHIYPPHEDDVRKPTQLYGYYIAWIIPLLHTLAGLLLVSDDITHFFCTPTPTNRGFSIRNYKNMLSKSANEMSAGHSAGDMKLSGTASTSIPLASAPQLLQKH